MSRAEESALHAPWAHSRGIALATLPAIAPLQEAVMRVVRSVLATALALALAPAAFAGNEAPFVDTNTLRQVQQTLRSRGFDPGVVDGRMGRATQEAIRAFQRAESLEATGQLNSRTLTALGLQDDSAAAPRGADDPKVVRRVQQTLNNRWIRCGFRERCARPIDARRAEALPAG